MQAGENPTVVTQRLIAEKVGVSQRLVAYALNGNGRMGAETRRRVLEEASRLGYRPNRAAQALVTGRSNLVALCLPHLATAFCSEVVRVVESLVRPLPYDLVVTGLGSGEDNEQGGHFPLSQWPMDGALFLDPTHLPKPPHPWGDFRIVVMGRQMQNNANIYDYVCVDLGTAAREAMAHLRSRGCKKIAYMAPAAMFVAGEGRYDAYAEEIALAGHAPILIPLETEGKTRAVAAATFHEFINEHGHPDGLMCGDDEIAIGICRTLRKLGLQIPQDVAIVGCDGIQDTEDMQPTLTTIELPVDEMVDQAWKLLMQRLENPELPGQSVTLQARLIHRDSS
jgi:DNA-binding LacI/PurR family transcriptional regulator